MYGYQRDTEPALDRFENLKLIVTSDRGSGTRYELYDLRRDPGEQRRLPARDLRRSGLAERLAAVRDRNQDLNAAMVAHGAQRRAAPDPETAERLRALGYFD